MGDKTQPCGTPVFIIMLVDILPLTVACCDLSCKERFNTDTDRWIL